MHQAWHRWLWSVLLLAGTAQAGEPSAGLALDPLALRVRTVLQSEPDLAPFNLGVSATGRIVRLWGSVPSRELADRAATLAARVPGVDVVVSELAVRPLTPSPAVKLPPPPLFVSSLSPQALLIELPCVPAIPMRAAFLARAALPVQPAAAPSAPGPRAAALRLWPAATYRWVTPEVGRPPIDGSSDPAAAIEAIRRGDPRFAAVTVEYRDGVALIRGAVPEYSDVWDLVRALNRIAGVTARVVQIERLH